MRDYPCFLRLAHDLDSLHLGLRASVHSCSAGGGGRPGTEARKQACRGRLEIHYMNQDVLPNERLLERKRWVVKGLNGVHLKV